LSTGLRYYLASFSSKIATIQLVGNLEALKELKQNETKQKLCSQGDQAI